MLKCFRNRRLFSSSGSSFSNNASSNPVVLAAMDRICPPSCSLPPFDLLNEVVLSQNNPNLWMDSPFSFNELSSALNSSKSNSSPGIDKIDYKILRFLPYDLKILFLKIINNLFYLGEFPKLWSHSLVYLIPKPHGGGVRPIALTSCALKVIEKLSRLY